MYKRQTNNSWQIVQDVAWKDYMIVPKFTMAGYTVMMKEVIDQINQNNISHIILQAGVGGMAGAMIAGIARYMKNIPETMVVEPDSAACVLESIRTGKIDRLNADSPPESFPQLKDDKAMVIVKVGENQTFDLETN